MMTRYYFDIRDGNHLALDEEGLEFPAIGSAEIEAARSLADLAREVGREAGRRRLSIEVRADTGPLFNVTLSFEGERILH